MGFAAAALTAMASSLLDDSAPNATSACAAIVFIDVFLWGERKEAAFPRASPDVDEDYGLIGSFCLNEKCLISLFSK